MLGQILLQMVLIALNAVFACAEIAIISVNDTKLDKMAASGNKKAVRLKKLTAEPSRFLATIQVAITLSGFIGSAFAADNFAERLVKLLAFTGLSAEVLHSVSVVVITLILSYFTLVFGELLPKRLAMKNSEKLALGLSGLIYFISKIFAPIVGLLNLSTNGLLRLLRINPQDEEETVTEEEILMMTDAGAEKGTIDEIENTLIKNVFAFDDLIAEQVCTHRTDVTVLWMEDSSEVWEETIQRSPHLRFPICGERVDDVQGVLNAKEYFRLKDRSKENVLKNAVHEPFFVHETLPADKLFAQMKRSSAEHFAVVVDEYGGMSGIITITDLLEELVGDLDEDENTEKVKQISENEWEIAGVTPLDEVVEALNVTLPADLYDTFGGYVIAHLDEIPKDGTQIQLDTEKLHIEILEMKRHRILRCKVQILQA